MEAIFSEDDPSDAAAIEAGRLLFAKPCTFLRGVARLDQLPSSELPEVAFSGRSNVGKSSLLNALTGRIALARTSNTPGRTQQLNMFDLSGRLQLVDLPGYGYAQAPKEKVAAWTDLVFAYMRGRPNLRLVCLLIDARHGFKPADEAAMSELARAAVAFQIILTKCDLVTQSDRSRRADEIANALDRRPGALRQVLQTSSRRPEGIASLRALLGTYAAVPRMGHHGAMT